MNKRFTVRRDKKTTRWVVWDRLQNKLVRSYPGLTRISADSLCKYMNNNYKVVQA